MKATSNILNTVQVEIRERNIVDGWIDGYFFEMTLTMQYPPCTIIRMLNFKDFNQGNQINP